MGVLKFGQFVGKSFLNTIEYLDQNSNEWTTFIPKISGELGSHKKSRSRRNSARKSISEEANKTISMDKQLKESPVNGHTHNGTTS